MRYIRGVKQLDYDDAGEAVLVLLCQDYNGGLLDHEDAGERLTSLRNNRLDRQNEISERARAVTRDEGWSGNKRLPKGTRAAKRKLERTPMAIRDAKESLSINKRSEDNSSSKRDARDGSSS